MSDDLKELEKCKNDMVYFIEKYCFILNDRQKSILKMSNYKFLKIK